MTDAGRPLERHELVTALKHAGEATADELAADAGRHRERRPPAARRPGRRGPGHPAGRARGAGAGPTHLYQLTRAAEPLFPKAYGGLTTELLGYVADADPDLVDDIFDRRRQRRLEGAQARLAPAATFAARVAELARILDEDGYLADFEAMPDGTFRIVEHNCAVLDVAERYGQACSSEIAFLRQALPDARIERVSHMIAGAHSCAYEIVLRCTYGSIAPFTAARSTRNGSGTPRPR